MLALTTAQPSLNPCIVLVIPTLIPCTSPLSLPLPRALQFGGQEPENDEKIAEFCELNHGVSFPLMAKSDVNGDNTNEVYKWLKSQKAGLLGLTRIKVSHR